MNAIMNLPPPEAPCAACFLLTLAAAGGDVAALHDRLLRHRRIRDCASPYVYCYLVKVELMSADEFSDLIAGTIPGVFFFASKLQKDAIAGFVRHDIREWLQSPPPPPRDENHEPDADAIGRLPLIAGLQFAARQAARMLDFQIEGHA